MMATGRCCNGDIGKARASHAADPLHCGISVPPMSGNARRSWLPIVRRYPGMRGLSCTSDRFRNHRCSPEAAAVDLLAETSGGTVIRYIAHSSANITSGDVNRGLAGGIPTDTPTILLASQRLGCKILIL